MSEPTGRLTTATLLIHVCAARRAYKVTFSTEAQAIGFLSARTSTHNWEEIPLDGPGSGSVPTEWFALRDYLYPTCEHGMSLDLCYGPDHFMSAYQEQAMDWDYSDAPAGF
jgi:hypothetical protein